MKRINLIACDMDGTLLLGSAQDLQPETCGLIQRLQQEKQILFCAASGRQYQNMLRLFAPIKEQIIYLCENGCICFVHGECIHKVFMERQLAMEIIETVMETDGAEVLVSCEDTHYIQPKDMKYYYHLRDVVHNKVTLVDNILEVQDPILKVSVYEKGGLYNVSGWQQRFGGRCTVVTGGGEWLDMMAAGVNKATGLQVVLDYLGLQPSECMAIGDNDNDREMLALVGTPVAVQSAKPAIREMASLETDTVEHLFERILENQQ